MLDKKDKALCKCVLCLESKKEEVKIIKRIVVPGDQKPDQKPDNENCTSEKIKITIPFDPNCPIGKQVTDYKEILGTNSHVLMALFTGKGS